MMLFLNTLLQLRKYNWQVALIVFFSLLISCQEKPQQKPKVVDGEFNLSTWDFKLKGMLNLDGEWKFYWGKQITSRKEADSLKHGGTCNILGFWTEEVSEGTMYKQNGVATYHLELTLPDTIHTYSLEINTVYTAYELWGNGRLLTKVGEVGDTPESTQQDFQTQLVELPQNQKIQLFLQVASWEHRRGGGVADPIRIGTKNQIQENWKSNFMGQLIVFTVIFTLSFYLFLLYFFYPNKSYVYLGLFALLGGLRAICVDELVIEEFFTHFPYFINQRLRYIGFFASIGFVILYVDAAFKKFSNQYFRWGAYLLLGFSLATLIIPFRWSTYLSPYFQAVAIPFTVYGLCIGFYVVKRGGIAAWFLTIGGVIIFLTMVHYLLYANNIIEGRLYHNFGYIAFIISQMLSLSENNRKVYVRSNKLAEELLVLNKNLEQNVELRTLKIKEQSEELRIQRDQISEQADKLQSSNDQLKELDQAKNRFFANISHELRTPLTVINGLLNRLITKVKPENQRDIGVASYHSKMLHQLINQLLDVTKLDAGKMKLKVRKEPIVRLLKSYMLSFESLANQKNIKLVFSSNADKFDGYLDRYAIEKVVYNLLSNAYKFTPENGQMSLLVDVNDGYLNLIIQDTGIGIPKTKLSHIFDRFYQVEQTLNKVNEGTGIGLTLVKELIDLHRGTIRVDSEKGKGTSFFIQISIAKSSYQPNEIIEEFVEENDNSLIPLPEKVLSSSTAIEEENVQDLSKPLLLLVEDHSDLQELMKDDLKKEYRFIQAYNGEEGIEMALEHVPDLIISDVMMPKKTGFELCEALKRDQRTSHIPIVLLTARAEQMNKLQGLEMGADDYLAKPFDAHELKARARNLIQGRELLRKRFAEKTEFVMIDPQEITHNATDQAFMEKLSNEFANNFSNENYGVEQIAEALNISARQMNRKLKAMIGLSTNKILQNFRLQKSKELLENPELQVKEIGFMVGFASAPYFNKCFRDKFNMTPIEYRKGLKHRA